MGVGSGAELKARYPCREAQIDQLLRLVEGGGPTGLPVFVSGPPATGKTAIVKDLMRACGFRSAYVNCNETVRVKPVLSSVLHQLKGGKRCREDGYELASKCDTINDFLLQLPGVVARRREPCWVVVDNAQRATSSDAVNALVRARGATGAPLGLLLISAAERGTGRAELALDEVAAVHFPAYTPPQLLRVLSSQYAPPAGEEAHWQEFLKLLVPAFCRASRDLRDVQTVVAGLYERYVAPVRAGQAVPPAALWQRVKADVGRAIFELDPAAPATRPGDSAAPLPGRAPAPARPPPGAAPGGRAAPGGLSFELPFVSKFLLLAAYIASRNKPASDRAVFDPSHRKRGRRNAQAVDRLAEAAAEAALRGPHAFQLERLLAIFWAIYAAHGADDDTEDDGAAEQTRGEMLQSEVLCQVSTLVRLRLLAAGAGGDSLDAPSFRCGLADEAAMALAANVRLRLGDYLKLA